MKKLMIALAAVAVAAGVQASAFTWRTANSQYVYVGDGTTVKLTSGTAYIFDAAKVSQTALLTAFANDKTFDISTFKVGEYGAIDHQAVASGAIAKSADVTYGTAETTYQLYFAIVNGDNLFISAESAYTAPSGADSMAISFSPKTGSKPLPLDATAGYKGTAWYTAVPEPTSGLLLLLGVAGLAPKRRRA